MSKDRAGRVYSRVYSPCIVPPRPGELCTATALNTAVREDLREGGGDRVALVLALLGVRRCSAERLRAWKRIQRETLYACALRDEVFRIAAMIFGL